MKPWLKFVLCLFILSLSACGKDDTTRTEAKSANTTYTLKTLPKPANQHFALPKLSDVQGQLLFVQGDTESESRNLGHGGRMYLASFDGTPPTLLEERVSDASVLVSPDGSMVGYAAVKGRRWYLYVMDLATQKSTQLLHLQNRFGFIEGWSPDMQWVMLRTRDEMWISSIDGQTQYKFENVWVFWLEDNRALVIQFSKVQEKGNPQSPIKETFIFDPLTDTKVAVELNETALMLVNFPVGKTAPLQLAETLSGGNGVFGYPLPISTNTRYAVQLDGEKFCGDFVLNNASADEVIYTVDKTFGLADFVETPDGSLYFQRWYLAGCILQPQNLHSEVIQIAPDKTVTALATDIYPGISTNYLRASIGRKYTISPDGRYMVWISGSWAGLTTSIRMMDLETGVMGDLMLWESTDTNSFITWEAYNAVFWIE